MTNAQSQPVTNQTQTAPAETQPEGGQPEQTSTADQPAPPPAPGQAPLTNGQPPAPETQHQPANGQAQAANGQQAQPDDADPHQQQDDEEHAEGEEEEEENDDEDGAQAGDSNGGASGAAQTANSAKVSHCLVQGCTFGANHPKSPKELLAHLAEAHLQVTHPSLVTSGDLERMGLWECRDCHKITGPGTHHPSPCMEVILDAKRKEALQALRDLAKANALGMRWEEVEFLKDKPLEELLAKPIQTFDIRTKSSRVLDHARQVAWATLAAAHDPNVSQERRDCALKAFYLLPGWLLRLEGNKKQGQTNTEVLTSRLTMLLDGQLQELEDARQKWMKAGKKKAVAAEGLPTQANRRASKLLSTGDVGRATACVLSPGRILDPQDPKTPWVKERLQGKLLLKGDKQASVKVEPEAAVIAVNKLEAVIKDLQMTSGGPSGWRNNHIRVLFLPNPGPLLMAQHLTALLKDTRVDQVIGSALRTGALTVLDKGSQDVRPIGCMEATIRLLGRYIVATEQGPISKTLLPEQLGVGVKGGAETAVHTVRLAMDCKPTWVAAMIDVSNAYGAMLRSKMAEAVEQLPPDQSALHRFYFNRFVAPTTTFVTASGFRLQADVGVVQGDSLSPELFGVTLDPVVKMTSASIENDSGFLFAYLDDVAIIGEPATVAKALAKFTEEAAKIGLKVNEAKTHWLGDPARQTQVVEAITTAGLPPPGPLKPAVKFLGAPVGISAEAEQPLLHKLIDEVPYEALRAYPDLQGRMLMLRIGLNSKFSYLMRTSRWKPEVCNKVDKLLHEQVLAILDMEFENSEWGHEVYEQSSLPMNLGGLGVTHSLTAAPIAYALSSIQAYQRAPNLLNPTIWASLAEKIKGGHGRSGSQLASALSDIKAMLKKAKDAVLNRDNVATSLGNKQKNLTTPHTAAPAFPESIGEALKWEVPDKAQRRLLEWCGRARQRALYEGKKPHDQARILARCQPGSYAWLLAIPINALFIIKSQAYRVALRQRMGIPFMEYLGVSPKMPCSCSYTKKIADKNGKPTEPVPLDDYHSYNCAKYRSWVSRHNGGVDVLEMAANSVNYPTRREVKVTKPPSKEPGKKACQEKYDLSLTLDGVMTHYDFTIVNTGAKHCVAKAAEQGLVAAEIASQKKLKQYVPKTAQGELFVPLAVEVYGGMHKNLFMFLGKLSLRALNRAPEDASYTAKTFIAYWTQALAVATVRAVAQNAITLADNAVSRHAGHGGPGSRLALSQ